MRYGSICSGIEAATAAWHGLGWEPAFFSEIDNFPCAVLKQHYPDVPLHGDFTTINGDEYGDIDLLVGGTPCQDFSVAGLRAGFAGERGNLTLEFARLVDRMRPQWVVWENVPGVLSIDGGRAFGAFLGALAKLGYGFAYRILDAQHFGVPQRRRRVFVVGCFGDWRRAAAVLFERESLLRNPPPRREKRKGVTPILEAGARTGKSTTDLRAGSGIGNAGDPMFTLQAGKQRAIAAGAHLPALAFQPGNLVRGAGSAPSTEVFPTLKSDHGRGKSDQDPHVAFASDLRQQHAIAPTLSARTKGGGGLGTDFECDGGLITHSLRGEGFDASEDGTGRGTPLVAHAFDARQRDVIQYGDKTGPLDTDGWTMGVSFDLRGREGGAQFEGPHTTANIRAASGGSSRSYVAAKQVRRLTPRECERLQGFPENYTAITYRGKPAADGPRYKALGNSMAVPVMRWIGERIEIIETLAETNRR